MFENALVRRPYTANSKLDIGALAEALLYYQNVELVLERSTLAELVRAISLDTLVELIENGFVKLTFIRDMLAVYHNDGLVAAPHRIVSFQLARKGTKKLPSIESLVEETILRTLGSPPKKGPLKRLVRRMPVRRTGDIGGSPEGVVGAAKDDLRDGGYIDRVVPAIVESLVPEYRLPAGSYFRLIETTNGFIPDTNYPFADINAAYHRRVPPEHSTLNPAYLLSKVVDVRADISFTAEYMGELVTDPVAARLLSIKFGDLCWKRNKNAADIEAFQQMTLGNGKALREAINRGDCNFDELIEVLRKAKRFKEWLAKAHPDNGLLQEYHNAVTSETWIDKLPGKGMRFGIFTAAGMGIDLMFPTGFGTAAGLSISAADTFVLDRLIRGWKPNQFIQNALLPYINDASPTDRVD